MSTIPPTPAPITGISWVNLLISLGASLGSSFLGGPAGNLINVAATTTENLIAQISAAKATAAAGGTSTGTALILPIFVSVLKAALAVALAENKISAADGKALSDALTAMGQEDVIAQAIVDYTSIGLLAPLP